MEEVKSHFESLLSEGISLEVAKQKTLTELLRYLNFLTSNIEYQETSKAIQGCQQNDEGETLDPITVSFQKKS